jgi:hypothetical protein
VHRAEREVHADDHEPEVPACPTLVEHLAEHLRPPVVDAGEEAEHGATEDHVVEVGDDVVGVGLLGVGGATAWVTPDRPPMVNMRDQADREQHRVENHSLPPHMVSGPVDDLHAGRHRDEHRGHREHGDRDRADAGGEHVVGPHAEAHEADGAPENTMNG